MKRFTRLAVVVLTLIAAIHLIRVLNGWEATVAGRVIPQWISALAFVIAGSLAFFVWREHRR
jgi:hypothetical protein